MAAGAHGEAEAVAVALHEARDQGALADPGRPHHYHRPQLPHQIVRPLRGLCRCLHRPEQVPSRPGGGLRLRRCGSSLGSGSWLRRGGWLGGTVIERDEVAHATLRRRLRLRCVHRQSLQWQPQLLCKCSPSDREVQQVA